MTSSRFARMSLLVAVLSISAVGCSHLSQQADGTAQAPTNDSPAVIAENPALADAPPTAVDLSDSGSDLEAIPLAVNKQVLMWIDYFQGQGRPHMERYLSRSARYMPLMKGILKKEGLPEDLIYIALIESGFSSTAHSSANAVGYWQFIRGTGRRYNLRIDSYVDERRDFVKSTKAAADYFKGLYNLFGAWYLAIASYNVGENRVKNLIMKYHTRDFWQLARENKLPDETINYVPKFLAARLIAKEPEKYGFTDVEYMAPLEFAEVDFPSSIDLRKLAKEMNLEYDDIRDLNPSYKRGVALMRGEKLTLRVPKGTEQVALAAGPNSVAGNVKIYVADEDYSYYKIRRGDTIASIARKFNTSQRNIRTLNRLSVGARLVAGRRLRVPGETVGGLASAKEPSRAKATRSVQNAEAIKPALGVEAARQYFAADDQTTGRKADKRNPAGQVDAQKIHVVRRGDTLIEIAKRYQVSLRKLANHNRIGRRSKVIVGTKLEIP